MPLKPPRSGPPFQRLVKIMAQLRSRRGCPWDRRQTHVTLKPYLIEEAYEVLEAIDSGDAQRLKGELGDLLLQAVFHAQVAREAGRFGIDDVVAALADKLVQRHPHVYGNTRVRGAAEQTLRWEEIKAREAGHRHRKSIVNGVPQAMPALLRASRVLSKAGKARFQWNGKKQAWAKFEEELREFRAAARGRSRRHKEEELGDLLTALVNVARFEGLDAEHCLHQGVRKLVRRIRAVEERAGKLGLNLGKLPLKNILKTWQEVKARERRR